MTGRTKLQPERRIIVVTEGGPHIWAIVNAIGEALGAPTVILEEPESKAALLKRRARRLGIVPAAGQLGTMVLIRLTKRLAARRMQRLVAEERLDISEPAGNIERVALANSRALVEAVRRLDPAVVLLAGCRLLSPAILAQMPCPVLNYHAGITPLYRGMNGGYWALARSDAENFGATVHLVDAGVDTGAAVRQVRTRPGKDDTIALYPLRLAAASRGICIEALRDAIEGRLQGIETGGPSRQWYHPTLWSYLWTGLSRGVW